MKKSYRQPKTKMVKLGGKEDIMQDIYGVGTQSAPETGYAKQQGNTVFDDLFDKVDGPSDMTTTEQNDYATHSTVE